MAGTYGVLVILVMLLLRLAVPVGISAALCYALHRLDVKWQAGGAGTRG